MSAKIKDVAKKANVSIATVSRVVNNVPLVNEETRERVLQAIKETGYRPNAIARSLKLQKTETVGVIIDDITIPYYAQIARGVQDILMQNGYNIIICNSDADNSKEEKFVDLFYQKQCDGIIFAGRELSKSVRKKIDYLNIPMVLCGIDEETGRYASVVNDFKNSIAQFMEKLQNRGYEKVSLILCDSAIDEKSRKTKKAFIEEAAKRGIVITDLKEIPVQFNMKNAYLAAREIIDNGMAEAIICDNDDMAVGAAKAIREAGKKVPEDIGVASLNIGDAGRWFSPELSGINHYMYDVGAISARMLVKILEKEETRERKVVVLYELIEGKTL